MAIINYGYKDGSGDYFIIVDTDNCDGCGKCVEACPRGVLELGPDDSDPLRDLPVARLTEEERKKIRYTCAACKPYLTSLTGVQREVAASEIKKLPCVAACEPGAITHSW